MSEEKFSGTLPKKKSARHLFNPVITPENIPQFTIPSLSILDSNRIFLAKKSFGWRSHQWHSQDDRFLNQTSRRRCSDPICKNIHGLPSVSFNDLPDPVCRAAMSLPHLPKIYTCYGFLTLGERPHILRKESFFFQNQTVGIKPTELSHSLQNSLISEIAGKNDYIQLIHKAENIRNALQCPSNTEETSTGTSIQKLPDSRKLILSRRRTIPVINSRNSHQGNKREWITTFLSQRSNSLPKIRTRSSKNLFQSVLKKHPSNLQHFDISSAELVENDQM